MKGQQEATAAQNIKTNSTFHHMIDDPQFSQHKTQAHSRSSKFISKRYIDA
jgi:hypothetical protein